MACTRPQSTSALATVHKSITVTIWLLFVFKADTACTKPPEYTSSGHGAQVYYCDNLASVYLQADTTCTRPPEYTSSGRGAQVYYCDNMASVCL